MSHQARGPAAGSLPGRSRSGGSEWQDRTECKGVSGAVCACRCAHRCILMVRVCLWEGGAAKGFTRDMELDEYDKGWVAPVPGMLCGTQKGQLPGGKGR